MICLTYQYVTFFIKIMGLSGTTTAKKACRKPLGKKWVLNLTAAIVALCLNRPSVLDRSHNIFDYQNAGAITIVAFLFMCDSTIIHTD